MFAWLTWSVVLRWLPAALGAVAVGWAIWMHFHATPPAPPGPPAAPITLHVVKPASQGLLWKIQADTPSSVVQWEINGPAGSQYDSVPDPDEKSILFTSPTGGDWLFRANAVVNNQPVWATLTISNGPQPPGPGPGPGPAPSPLTAALQKAYAEDTDANKADLKSRLQALYSQAKNTANDQSISTCVQLLTTLHEAAQNLVGSGMPKTRAAIAKHLDGVLPTEPAAALDSQTRAKAATAFGDVAQSLGEVK